MASSLWIISVRLITHRWTPVSFLFIVSFKLRLKSLNDINDLVGTFIIIACPYLTRSLSLSQLFDLHLRLCWLSLGWRKREWRDNVTIPTNTQFGKGDETKETANVDQKRPFQKTNNQLAYFHKIVIQITRDTPGSLRERERVSHMEM